MRADITYLYCLINKQPQGPRPTDCRTSPLRQPLHMHESEIRTTFCDTTYVTINAKAEPVCC